MKVSRKISHKLEAIRKVELCPSICNLWSSRRHSVGLCFNDVLSGIKIFFLLFPLALALASFCGTSPLQGVISCAVASMCSIILGGSKYQVSTVALPLCVITFEILAKYEYKGLLCTSIFVSIFLIILGSLRFSNVIKHLSSSYISALTVFVAAFILINQTKHILGINAPDNPQDFMSNFGWAADITKSSMLAASLFVVPLLLIRSKFKSPLSYLLYTAVGAIVTYVIGLGILPMDIAIETIGSKFNIIDNISTIERSVPSHVFLVNSLNYAFAVAIVIAAEASFCTNVAASITGDKKIQGNIELISSGVSNFASVASGGLLVSPNLTFTMKNIEYKSKTVMSLLFITLLSFLFIKYSPIIMNYIPIHCVSSILIIFSFFTLKEKKIYQYLNYKNNDSYIFVMTLLAALFFGFIPAVVIGFTMSSVFFAKRMMKINDANVHTTKNHDISTVDFMTQKNGEAIEKSIPNNILDRVEVIQINNILFLNIAKLVEEGLSCRGSFPSILIIYFKNIPFLDREATEFLRDIVKNAKEHECVTIVSGTNGMLLDILQEKAREYGDNVFGYVVPSFEAAIKSTITRLKS